MTQVVPTAPTTRQPSPGHLLLPFGWAAEPLAAMLRAEASLLIDLFAIDQPRMHLIALALAHLEPEMPFELARLLLRGSVREVLDQILPQHPAGVGRTLEHLPAGVLKRENYRRLVDLLADRQAAKVLYHGIKFDDVAIRVLAEMPQPLRGSLAIAVPEWPYKLDRLTEGLQFLVSRGIASTLEALVAELAPVASERRLAVVIERWVAALPLPETMPPAGFAKARRLDEFAKVRSLARAWCNCLADYRHAIDDGACAVYLWDDWESPAACVVQRRGRLGWFLDEVKGPRNATVEARQLATITGAFADVGVPSRQIVRAIERITCADIDRQCENEES